MDVLRETFSAASIFEEAVDGALSDFASLHQIDPTISALVVTVLLEAERDEELGRALQPSLSALRAFCDDIASLAPAGLAQDKASRRDLSRALVSPFSGIMVSAALLRRAPDYEAMVAAMRRMIVGGSGPNS